jgi:Flp pilus assembly protein TadD
LKATSIDGLPKLEPWRPMACKVLCGIVAFSLCVGPAISQTTPKRPGAVQEIQKAADAARERGDTEASLKLYERALASKPSWQEGWFYYGSLQYDESRYAGAAKAFRKLVQLNDQLGSGWAMLGLSDFETREYNEALTALQKAERLGTNDPSLQNIVDFHLALILNAHGDSDGASLLLSSLYLKGARSEDLQVALGLTLLRVPIFPVDLDPSRDALVHDAGNLAALVATKQTDKADAGFRDMLKRYPKVQFLHYAYGGELASTGRDAEATDQFKAETELNPDSALAYLEWAFVEMTSKNYEESKRLALKAVQLNDESFLAHYILGNSLLLSGDPKAAVPELEAARKLSPQTPEIRYSLSRAYARVGESALAKQEQTQFLALQRKNAIDRLQLLKRYPNAQSITGIRPTTSP